MFNISYYRFQVRRIGEKVEILVKVGCNYGRTNPTVRERLMSWSMLGRKI